MRYTVTWWRNVQDDLTQIWLAAPDKQAISMASDMLERQLRHDPMSSLAVAMPNNCWALAAHPLRILYRIRTDDCIVEVLHVQVIHSVP